MEWLFDLINNPPRWTVLLWIALFFGLAFGFQRISRRLAERILGMSVLRRRQVMREERRKTLVGLTSSMLTLLGYLAAVILSLAALEVDVNSIVWAIGLFAAAFGLGARPLVSDFLTGVSFLFEDPYDVGEKVELLPDVQGVVEEVNLRTTQLRSRTGELYTVPNGEVRLVRNFSRGRFSVADIKVSLAASDIERALPILESLGKEAVVELPNLLEPWRIISETGTVGSQTELTLNAKARFGRAAEMRPRMLALVQRRLEEAGIEVA